MSFDIETTNEERNKEEVSPLILNTVILSTAIWGLFVFLPIMGICLTREEIAIYVLFTLALSLGILLLGSVRKNGKRGD